jgi:MoaA/NifB/PqqE/SkfB family radical SAM enzyme
MLEETGIENIGDFRFGGYLGYQTADVAWRRKKEYNTLRVHGLTYLFVGRMEDIQTGKHREKHIRHEWTAWEDASEKIWIKEYGKEFFERWKKKRWEIFRNVARPISLAFQVTEKCAIDCTFCLRRLTDEETPSLEGMKEVIDILSERGILRLTFTGGEPLSIGKTKLFAVIKYANRNRIYTCLSTRGLGLRQEDITELEGCLDHLLVSLHALDKETASHLYDSSKWWEKLREQMDLILEWTKNSKIIVEVSTVVTKKNIHQIIPIGEWLFRQNKNLFWKIEEYYANGIQSSGLREEFEISAEDFKQLEREIGSNENLNEKLSGGRIRFSSKESREKAPDVMITPPGNLVFSKNHEYEDAGNKLDLLNLEFRNRRPWQEYRNNCRNDWNW